MSTQDENRFADERTEGPDLGENLIEPAKPAQHRTMPGAIRINAAPPTSRDDADLTADAMKALEDRLLALVPTHQRNQVQDMISDLLDLAPGQALDREATHALARRVLTPCRTLEDWAINQYARFYPHSAPEDETGDTEYPCIELGGDDNNVGDIQVYVYANQGRLVISQHFDNAGPDEQGRGPWAYYGPDHAIPVLVLGGDGKPVYVAAEGAPALSDALIAAAHRWLGKISGAQERGDTDAVADAGMECAMLLDAFMAITGHPYVPESRPEGDLKPRGGFTAEGGSGA